MSEPICTHLGPTSEIDWVTVKGCAQCNEHGPFLPGGTLYNPEHARDLHQAWHRFVAELLKASRIDRLVARLASRYAPMPPM
jgi:hypothetical protein